MLFFSCSLIKAPFYHLWCNSSLSLTKPCQRKMTPLRLVSLSTARGLSAGDNIRGALYITSSLWISLDNDGVAIITIVVAFQTREVELQQQRRRLELDRSTSVLLCLCRWMSFRSVCVIIYVCNITDIKKKCFCILNLKNGVRGREKHRYMLFFFCQRLIFDSFSHTS